MPTAWEMRDNPNVLVGILHVDTTTIAWALGLRRLIIPGQFQEPLCVSGMPFDHGRNALAMRALEMGADFLMMIDSDVIPPADAILRLLRHKEHFISGVYHRRSPPHGIPVMQKPVGVWLQDYPRNAVIEVDVVGAGCLLISREFLEKVPPQRPEAGKHWFDWRVDMQGILPHIECLSEDFSLAIHAKRTCGFRTLVDTSVQCKHVGLAEATYRSLLPCSLAPA